MAIDSVRRSLAPDRDAPAAARRALDGFRGQLDEDVTERSALVVTELVINSVTHAGLTAAQPIDLSIQVLPGRLRIEVTDKGTAGFDPVVTPPDVGQNSGRGLWMVDQLPDRRGVEFTRSARVWCEFDLDPHYVGREVAEGSLAIRQMRARSALRIRPVNQGRSRV